jgi:predicted transcriptional regulator
MRTTLTLDDDVAMKLRELAHRRRVPFKEVVDSVLPAESCRDGCLSN